MIIIITCVFCLLFQRNMLKLFQS